MTPVLSSITSGGRTREQCLALARAKHRALWEARPRWLESQRVEALESYCAFLMDDAEAGKRLAKEVME